MNVTTLTITAEQARRQLAAYRLLTDRQRTLVDEQMIRLYRMVQQGAEVINVQKAFAQTGLNEHGQPKLAMARADWDTAWFHPRQTVPGYVAGGGLFTATRHVDSRLRTNLFQLPASTFDNAALTRNTLRAPVPHIPPSLRPQTSLTNFHILFEVEAWEEYPADPFLLRHVYGPIYVIEAKWDLTPLEVELLSALSA